MKKKGFTLVELLAVIAILAILVIMALPAVLRMFNNARRDSFTNEVNTVIRTARQQYLLSGGSDTTWTNAEGSTKSLELTGNSNLKYYIKMNNEGKIIKLQVSNGDFQYSKSGIIDVAESSDVKATSELSQEEILVIDGSGLNPGETVPICIRATTLHTSICTNISDSRYYCRGNGFNNNDTITYGNLGTEGVLTAGDAFDCDVNNDGIYNPNTERFYYVSPKDADTSSDYVTLIYYNNVTNGIPDSDGSYAYSSRTFIGPDIGYLQLPTTSQWPNVSLTESTRQIKNSSEGTIVDYDDTIYNLPTFTYENRAARLLSLAEARIACGNVTQNGGLGSCLFLLENTCFTNSSYATGGYWLENYVNNVYYVQHTYATVPKIYANLPTDNTWVGIRPVIEVDKKNIDY